VGEQVDVKAVCGLLTAIINYSKDLGPIYRETKD
jgi:hypothetical protein